MGQFDHTKHPDVQVHESAFVDEPCVIGAGTKIWHFTHVMPNCRIGRGCNLGQNVVISPEVILGNNVKVQNNVSIYTGVILEDDVFCGPSMVFTNVINPRSEIVRRGEYHTTLVKHGATMGANCTILCGSTIGRFAFIAAGAVVLRDVSDYALMVGLPAKPRGWSCRCGYSLPPAKPESTITCPHCENEYRLENEVLTPLKEGQDRE
ncbi:MAG: N-acetyltransferase [Planctomycetes bacterium]|nr:N-acetyltransferase [Planctomycetota bacterium]